MAEINSSSVRALGLGLMFLGGSIVLSNSGPFLFSMFLSEDVIRDATPSGLNIEDNPLFRMITYWQIWAGNIFFGLIYIYVASQFREFKSWSRWTIILMSGLLPVIALVAMAVILSGIPGAAGFSLPPIFALIVLTAVLIWYLSKKNVKVHFTS